MVKLSGPLLVGWRPGLDKRGPLVLIRVEGVAMYRIGLSRIISVDPHGAYAADPQMMRCAEQLRPLHGRGYSTLVEAADAIFRATAWRSHVTQLMALECFVEGRIDRALLGEKLEGLVNDTYTSPGLMHTHVNITDGARADAGEWIAVGLLRPFLPPGMLSEEANEALYEMREKARRRGTRRRRSTCSRRST